MTKVVGPNGLAIEHPEQVAEALLKTEGYSLFKPSPPKESVQKKSVKDSK